MSIVFVRDGRRLSIYSAVSIDGINSAGSTLLGIRISQSQLRIWRMVPNGR